MDKAKELTSDSILKFSEKFAHYHADLERLASSIEEDMGILFPPFTGYHPEGERLREMVTHLRMHGEYLNVYSESLLKISEIISHAENSDDTIVKTF